MQPVIDKEETGKRLRFLMNVNNISPREIQEYLNLSCIQTVYHWMSGVSIPKTEHLYSLSCILNVGMDTILIGNKEDYMDKDQKEKMDKIIEIMDN